MPAKLTVNGKVIKNFGEIGFSDDLEMTCSILNFPCDEIFKPGAKFVLKEDNEHIVSGIITDCERGMSKIYSYTGYDYGFYLKQNEIMIQFRNTKISDAIKQLCNKINVPVGVVPSIPATVTKIFKDVTVSDVLFELLELVKKKTGQNYFFECLSGKLNVRRYGVRSGLTYKLADGFEVVCTDAIGSISAKESMQDLKNRVIIPDKSEKVLKPKAVHSAQASIKKYGLLQAVEPMDDDKSKKYEAYAATMLEQLNKTTKTLSVEMLGTFKIKKGVILPMYHQELGLNGYYLVKRSRHTKTGNKHIVECELEQWTKTA
ncbi:MAG: hypothetical protein PHE78_08615 [Candidatus Gastranaerophilales bacterium]|nr:hypothetical protein [Candidatus Gastranaerophilales bacterium]